MRKDMTIGNPMKIILFSPFPVLLGNLFQQFYNMVNTVIVGHYSWGGCTAPGSKNRTGEFRKAKSTVSSKLCSCRHCPLTDRNLAAQEITKAEVSVQMLCFKHLENSKNLVFRPVFSYLHRHVQLIPMPSPASFEKIPQKRSFFSYS